MQEKSTATTKGPGAITGVRTKNSFSLEETDTPVAPKPEPKPKAKPTAKSTWILADSDIDVGGGNIVVAAHEWTEIADKKMALKAIHQAGNRRIQCIIRDSPPPKGR